MNWTSGLRTFERVQKAILVRVRTGAERSPASAERAHLAEANDCGTHHRSERVRRSRHGSRRNRISPWILTQPSVGKPKAE